MCKEKSQDRETYRSEVGDSCIVRVGSTLPHPVDQELSEVEQNCNLQQANTYNTIQSLKEINHLKEGSYKVEQEEAKGRSIAKLDEEYDKHK